MAIKVAFFDCDGTLTKIKSSWEYLHRRLNIWDNNADRYQTLFREGKIDYYEFCKRDALLWKGLDVSRVNNMLQDIEYHKGSLEVIKALKKRSIFNIILSTGLSLLVEKVKEDLGMDMALSNELLSACARLTGEIKINVEFNKKGYLVEKILKEIGVSREDACAIGDGEGDAGMFEAVGLAIGFHPHNSVSPFIHKKIYGESLIDMIRIIDDYERKSVDIRLQTGGI
jgi:phosphoserine phosphatase